MRYLLLFIYLFLYIIRPSEWVPGMIGTPLLLIVGIISIITIVFGVVSGQCSNVLSGDVERMMLGFIGAICLSHLSHGYAGGAVTSTERFLPSFTGFFLVLTTIRDRKHFNVFIIFLIALISYVAYEGIQQYTSGFAAGGLEPLFQKIYSVDGEPTKIARIRWYGVFNDPNDLGLLLIIAVPFLIDMLMRRRFLIPLISLPLIITALYYTNSRGSMLAGVVAICVYFVIRFRSQKGLLLGLLIVIPLLLFGPSRMGNMSGKEESAHGRIESWYEGYQMFKGNPLFGVGMESYTDYNELTAHNSFVLVMAELGFVGLFFFTGLIYYPLTWLRYALFSKNTAMNLPADDLSLISSIFASFAGVLAAIFFISRAYVLIPFLLIALTTSINRILAISSCVVTDKKPSIHHLKLITLLTLTQIIVINIIVKVFI